MAAVLFAGILLGWWLPGIQLPDFVAQLGLVLFVYTLGLASGLTGQALALAASVIAAVCYQGIVVQAVRDIQDGVRDLSLGKLFSSVTKVLGPLLWTALLVGLVGP